MRRKGRSFLGVGALASLTARKTIGSTGIVGAARNEGGAEEGREGLEGMCQGVWREEGSVHYLNNPLLMEKGRGCAAVCLVAVKTRW